MALQSISIYADTSVFGGAFDNEFATPSRAFFDEVRAGRFLLHLSALVMEELGPAPRAVRSLFSEMLALAVMVPTTPQALSLQRAYLRAGILTSRSSDDALHVALATVYRCTVIVSWNFKHIVHFQKMPMYNAVNAENGLGVIRIHSPPEVLRYGEAKDL